MSIKKIYSGLEKNLKKTIQESRAITANDSFPTADSKSFVVRESISRPFNFVKSTAGLESMQLTGDSQNYGVKELVRHKFGKHGTLMPSFGCHPDFSDMEEGELRNGYSVTMFMDIIGSTKLGVIFPPETVFKIKNDIIRCAIETVRSFDGHVHRIMGDAVMAFFRSENRNIEGRIADSAIDALNCATFLIEMFEDVVIPELSELGVDENIGIRIGIDYGSNDEVVWGKYGYMESQEVTATSFFVDVAAKLQQKAPKNSIMIGDSLVQLLGLDENYIRIKTRTKNNEIIPEAHLKPNYKDATGSPINYKQFVLRNERYGKLLPTSEEEGELRVRASLKRNEDDVSDDEYYPCSRLIKKGTGISFKGYFYSSEHYSNPKFKFRVVNTGAEAAMEAENGDHYQFVDANWSASNERYFAKQWEETSFKGLHHMYVSFWDGEKLIAKERCFSVFIND